MLAFPLGGVPVGGVADAIYVNERAVSDPDAAGRHTPDPRVITRSTGIASPRLKRRIEPVCDACKLPTRPPGPESDRATSAAGHGGVGRADGIGYAWASAPGSPESTNARPRPSTVACSSSGAVRGWLFSTKR